MVLAQNYIINPSFEDSTLNVYSKSFWSGTGTFTIDSSVTKSGNQSLKVTSGSGGTATVWQGFTVQPNNSYRYTGWIKTQNHNASGGSTGMEIKTSTGSIQVQNLSLLLRQMQLHGHNLLLNFLLVLQIL